MYLNLRKLNLISIRKTLLHFFGIFIFLLVFSAGLGSWSGVGSHIHQVISELPLLLLVYFLVYKLQRPNRKFSLKVLVALAPIVLLYIGYDYYYVSFDTVFRFTYLNNVVELLDVVTFWQLIALMMVLLLPFLLVLISINREQIKWFFSLVGLIVGLGLLVSFFPKSVLYYIKAIYPGTFYQHTVVMDNGRFIGSIYYEAKRQIALASLSQESRALNDERPKTLFIGETEPKDIYIVVLESFLDESFFKDLEMQPAKEALERTDIRFGLSESPVFGGQTPRAEFEVLCGVPSFASFGSNEFDFIEKGSLNCLPELLKEKGYLTVATNPYKPIYFNEARAYEKLGFDDINFLKPFVRESETYLNLEMPKKGFPFDGDVFNLNVQYIKKIKSDNPDRPIFNYVMTVYGHSPFYASEVEPDFYEENPKLSKFLNRALNMSGQTKVALQKYIADLKKISPESIILIVGDHLPAMPKGVAEYQNAGLSIENNGVYLTPRLFLSDGKPLYMNEVLTHFQYFYQILDQIQSNILCEQVNCKPEKSDLEAMYRSLMFSAVTS